MRILFIIENALKKDDSNSNIADIMLQYLRKNHEVFVLAKNTTENPKLKKVRKNRILYYFYLTAYEKSLIEIKEKKKDLRGFQKNKKKYFIMHPFLAMRRVVFGLHAKDNFRTLISKKIEMICNVHKMDVVVAVALPYHTAMALADAKVAAKKVVYQLDPYSDNYYFKDNPKTLEIEKDVLKKVDRVITSDLIYDGISGDERKKYIKKIHIIEYPNVRELKNIKAKENVHFPKGKINCCFVGNFYTQIRNPRFLFEVFSLLKDSNIVLHIIGDMYEGSLDDYRDFIGENIILYGKKPLQTAVSAMKQADILVSLNNTISNQVPGKIFDYISTGKPIINICKRPDCPTLKYMEKYPIGLNIIEYPLGINIIEGDNETEVSGKIQEFCKKNKGEQVDFSAIKELYKENTIEEAGKQFELYLR